MYGPTDPQISTFIIIIIAVWLDQIPFAFSATIWYRRQKSATDKVFLHHLHHLLVRLEQNSLEFLASWRVSWVVIARTVESLECMWDPALAAWIFYKR